MKRRKEGEGQSWEGREGGKKRKYSVAVKLRGVPFRTLCSCTEGNSCTNFLPQKNAFNKELNLKGRRMKQFECEEEGYSRPQDTSERASGVALETISYLEASRNRVGKLSC